MLTTEQRNEINLISNKIIGAAIEVHRNFGPGLLENIYEECLCYELDNEGIVYECQKNIPLVYKGKELKRCYRADFVIENKIVVELKTVDQILPIHEAQLLTYLNLSGLWLDLLINFNQRRLKNGIKRMVRGF